MVVVVAVVVFHALSDAGYLLYLNCESVLAGSCSNFWPFQPYPLRGYLRHWER